MIVLRLHKLSKAFFTTPKSLSKLHVAKCKQDLYQKYYFNDIRVLSILKLDSTNNEISSKVRFENTKNISYLL